MGMKTADLIASGCWVCECREWNTHAMQDCTHCGLPRPSRVPTAATKPPLGGVGGGEAAKAQRRARKGPNKTELRYRCDSMDRLFSASAWVGVVEIRHESLTFRLANGHRYTPDWVVYHDGRPVRCIEVKGPYIHSRDSRILFDQAAAENPGIKWVWAQWKDGRWHETEV